MNFLYTSVIGMFLYFPKDKTEYIPAAIMSVIFLIGALITMRWIIRHSKKEEEKMKEFEKTAFQEIDEKRER